MLLQSHTKIGMFQILRIYVCKPAIYCAVVVDSQNNWTIMVFLEYRA